MWYVYDKDSTIIQKTCKTRGAALAWRTRKHNEFVNKRAAYVSNDGPMFDWGCADAEYFHSMIEARVWKRNLMTGADVELTANTPRSCDPSSELYWSM